MFDQKKEIQAILDAIKEIRRKVTSSTDNVMEAMTAEMKVLQMLGKDITGEADNVKKAIQRKMVDMNVTELAAGLFNLIFRPAVKTSKFNMELLKTKYPEAYKDCAEDNAIWYDKPYWKAG